MEKVEEMESKIVNTRLFQYAKKETTPFRLFIQKCKYDWALVFSSMLAFNILLAIVPMTITLFGILGLLLDDHPDLQKRVKDGLINSFPSEVKQGLRELINMAFRKLYQDAGIILFFGILFAIIGSSRLFIAIDRCLIVIYRIKERGLINQIFLAIGMLFIFLILIPLMVTASSLPTFLLKIIPNTGKRFITYILGLLFSLLFSFILFEIIYLIIPNKKMTFKQTWCGALVAACSLELFMLIFPFYVKNFMTSYTGQIGFAIILLLFLFFAANILILGAQINAFFFEHIQPLPVSLGSFVSTLAHEYNQTEGAQPLNI